MDAILRSLERNSEVSHWIDALGEFSKRSTRAPDEFQFVKLSFPGTPKRVAAASYAFPIHASAADIDRFTAFLLAVICNRMMTVGVHKVIVESSLPGLAARLSEEFDARYDRHDSPARIRSMVENFFGIERFQILSENLHAQGKSPIQLAKRNTPLRQRQPRRIGAKVLAMSIGKHFVKNGLLEVANSGRLTHLVSPSAELTWGQNDDPEDAEKLFRRIVTGASRAIVRSNISVEKIDAIGLSLSVIVPKNRIVSVGTGFAESFDAHGIKLLADFPDFLSREFGGLPVYSINDGDAEALGIANENGFRNTLVLKLGNELAGGFIDNNGRVSDGVNEFTKVVIDIGAGGPLDNGTKIRGTAGQYVSWLGINQIASELGVDDYFRRLGRDADIPGELCSALNAENGLQRENARQVYERVGERLGDLALVTREIYQLDRVSIAGGLTYAQAGQALIRGCLEKVTRYGVTDLLMHNNENLTSLRFGCLVGAAHNVFE